MIDLYLYVVALADWDIILGEPILGMMQTIIDITNHMITIQPKSTDRPVTLSAIVNKAPRRQLVSGAQVTIAATDTIREQDEQPNIIEISYDDSMFNDKTSDNEITSPTKPYSYDDGVARLGYNPMKEFEDIFPLKKPTALPPMRAQQPNTQNPVLKPNSTESYRFFARTDPFEARRRNDWNDTTLVIF